jgi:putative acetyltransferase
MPTPEKLARDQVVIRRSVPADAEALELIMADPGVFPGLLQMPYGTADAWRARLESEVGDDSAFHLLALVGDEVVGSAGLHVHATRTRTRHSGHLGMSVRAAWQGRGIGGHLMEALLDLADNWFGLVRLQLEVYVDNAPAIALYERTGFEVEGTMRAYAVRDGQLVDAFLMSRIRPPLAPTTS